MLRKPGRFDFTGDAELGPLAGVPLTNGVRINHPQAGDAIQFAHISHGGKTINPVIRLTGKPKLAAAWAAHERAHAEYKAACAANLPGLDELRRARDEADRYDRQFGEMIDDESNDGARPPKPAEGPSFAELSAKHPRAALYLLAEDYSSAANDRKASAGSQAMELLAHGGSEDEARQILENWLPESAMMGD